MELQSLHFSDRIAFHQWLSDNHNTSPGIWMVYFKKNTGTKCIEYDDALDEALCFGWIDSIIKKIDEERYVRKFTPRINLKNWSDANRKRVEKLYREKRMTLAGLKKVDGTVQEGIIKWNSLSSDRFVKKAIVIPEFIQRELAAHESALSHFNQMPHSCRRDYILWITSAKKQETIDKRMQEAILLLKENKRLGLK